MSIILVLIPLSIVFAVAFLAAFIWAVRSGQYEDTCTPSMRLLLDDPASLGANKIERPSACEAAGVRPSPGAEVSEYQTPQECSTALANSPDPAPGDGRTPVQNARAASVRGPGFPPEQSGGEGER